jgi:cyclopropane-fatty-acyl-phospholipid synthase
MYSSAIYPYPESTLREAQQHKLATISKKLQLSEHDHVLEIGTGWGGLAIYMAQHYGCHVTTTTISDEQFAYAEEKVNALGLTDKITLLKQDYRKLTGKFDKLVSIEMIEAVGKSYLETFFKQCNQLLKDDGLMVLQSITISDQRFEHYANDVDFIQKHIFPGGFLPSLLTVNQSIKSCTDMMIRDLQDIGLDYAHTLKNWHQNLIENQDELNQLGYDDRFIRLWRYYFCYCEGGFLERATSTIQLVMTKPRYYDALTR